MIRTVEGIHQKISQIKPVLDLHGELEGVNKLVFQVQELLDCGNQKDVWILASSVGEHLKGV